MSDRTCKRKVGYSKSEANFQVKKRDGSGGSYKCPNCHHYHVTSKPRGFISAKMWERIANGGN